MKRGEVRLFGPNARGAFYVAFISGGRAYTQNGIGATAAYLLSLPCGNRGIGINVISAMLIV